MIKRTLMLIGLGEWMVSIVPASLAVPGKVSSKREREGERDCQHHFIRTAITSLVLEP